MNNIIRKFFILFIFPAVLYSQDISPDKIFAQVDNAIVVVYTYDFNNKLDKQGSGIILNDKGILVTNYHLFAGCERIELKRKDTIIKHEGIVGINIEKDILILKLSDNNFQNIPVCTNDTLRVGSRKSMPWEALWVLKTLCQRALSAV